MFNYKKPTLWIITASLVICCAAAVCLMTDPKDTVPELGVTAGTPSNGTAAAKEEGTDTIRHEIKKLLAENGISSTLEEAPDYSFLSGKKSLIKLENNDESIVFFTYKTAEKARKEAGYISKDGFSVNSEKDSVCIEWVAPPHWYITGNTILLYVGDNTSVTDTLKNRCGEQIAGLSTDERFFNRTYTTNTTVFDRASFTLNSDMSFSFYYSMLSSYIATGTYEETDGTLVLHVENGDTYTFEKSGNGFAFNARASTALPAYKYSENGEPKQCIADGTVFSPAANTD